jgi:predicted ArsR family transcriptional regulator
MSDQPTETAGQPGEPQPEQRLAPTPTKAAQVLKLLARSRGATLADLTAATGWQPHTVRAHLSRLRKAGHTLERLERKTGPDAYHFVGKPGRPDAAATSSDGTAGNG